MVTAVSNKHQVYSYDTYTAHSTKKIEQFTRTGGLDNHIRAIGEVIKLQAATVVDTANFSLAAAKAAVTLNMTLLSRNVNLAVKHASQACLTFSGLVSPRLVLHIAEGLGVRGQKLSLGWLDQVKALAKNLLEVGSGLGKQEVNAARKASVNMSTAIKIGSAFAGLGIAGLAISRGFGSGALDTVPLDTDNCWHFKSLIGILAFVGVPAYAVNRCSKAAKAAEEAKAAVEAEAAAAEATKNATYRGIDLRDLNKIVNESEDSITLYRFTIHKNIIEIYQLNEKSFFILGDQFSYGKIVDGFIEFKYEGKDHKLKLKRVISSGDEANKNKAEHYKPLCRTLYYGIEKELKIITKALKKIVNQTAKRIIFLYLNNLPLSSLLQKKLRIVKKYLKSPWLNLMPN